MSYTETAISSRNDFIAELFNATKYYKSVRALNNVNLQVQTGEILSILGPNGAGKTTIVNLLLGLLNPSNGKVRIFGQKPGTLANRLRVSAMLQISGVPETLKVRELLELFASYYPTPLKTAQVIEIAGLSEIADRLFGKLSGGQKQRLMFGLSICGNPDLLFLDEPTAGLDVESRLGFWKYIHYFASQGRTVVLTTHMLEEADALADRIIVLNQGEVVAAGTPSEIKTKALGRRISCVTHLESEDVAGLEGILNVRRRGQSLELVVAKPEPIVRELLSLDPELTDLSVSSGSLEEAFLSIVGLSSSPPEQEIIKKENRNE